MQNYFFALADFATASLTKQEVLLLNWRSESSDYCRFNHAKVRQAGKVEQRTLLLRLIDQGRQAVYTLSLTGEKTADHTRIKDALHALRQQVALSPADPHLLYATTVKSSERLCGERSKLGAHAISQSILDGSHETDLVGILAVGDIFRGFANSLGQRNWFETQSFNFDWSLYAQADKAVKCGYAGANWDAAAFQHKMRDAKRALAVVSRPAKSVKPGAYRVFLTPSAMREIMQLLSWGGFGLKANRTKQSSLMKLISGEASFDPRVHMTEAIAGGMSADFDSFGFRKPDAVNLVVNGAYAGSLTSARSAKEYEVETTGAEEDEAPESFSMTGGDLPMENALSELDTGLWINNLWYLNFSDRSACRMTGMTRFATLWVEKGEPVAPVNVMRFDDIAYRVLGKSGLSRLTKECDVLSSSETYVERSTRSHRLPGAIVDGFTLTL